MSFGTSASRLIWVGDRALSLGRLKAIFTDTVYSALLAHQGGDLVCGSAWGQKDGASGGAVFPSLVYRAPVAYRSAAGWAWPVAAIPSDASSSGKPDDLCDRCNGGCRRARIFDLGSLHLGRNSSGVITVKERHELIGTGPYHLVRHPIYSGLILAIIGSAIARGGIAALLAVGPVLFSFLRRVQIEERWMAETFGTACGEYRASTPALVPFLR